MRMMMMMVMKWVKDQERQKEKRATDKTPRKKIE